MLFIGSLYYTNAENRVVGLIGQAVCGEPIYFSFTIPETVKNLDGAISFVNFLLSTKSEHILESQGLNSIKPVIEGKTDKAPSSIRNMIEPIKQLAS
jgi:molybdate/tungstate transport system substrate-binding protein